MNYQVYPLGLISRRKGNWLHMGSSPMTWTNKGLVMYLEVVDHRHNGFKMVEVNQQHKYQFTVNESRLI